MNYETVDFFLLPMLRLPFSSFFWNVPDWMILVVDNGDLALVQQTSSYPPHGHSTRLRISRVPHFSSLGTRLFCLESLADLFVPSEIGSL